MPGAVSLRCHRVGQHACRRDAPSAGDSRANRAAAHRARQSSPRGRFHFVRAGGGDHHMSTTFLPFPSSPSCWVFFFSDCSAHFSTAVHSQGFAVRSMIKNNLARRKGCSFLLFHLSPLFPCDMGTSHPHMITTY